MKYYEYQKTLYFGDPVIYYTEQIIECLRSLGGEFRIEIIDGVPHFVPWNTKKDWGFYNSAIPLRLKRCGELQYCDLCLKKIPKRKDNKKNFDRETCYSCWESPFRELSRYNRFYKYKGRVNQLG